MSAPDGRSGIEVTARDLDTGEVGVRTLHGDDYCLIVSGRLYLAYEAAHKNGTHQLTIKVDETGDRS